MTDWFARPVLHVTDVEASLRFYESEILFEFHHNSWREAQIVTVPNSTLGRAWSPGYLRADAFIAEANRAIRVGLAFCQAEIALRELAGEAGNTIAQ